MVTVTTAWSLALSLRFVVGLVDVVVLNMDGFAAFPFPLFRDFAPLPFTNRSFALSSRGYFKDLRISFGFGAHYNSWLMQ